MQVRKCCIRQNYVFVVLQKGNGRKKFIYNFKRFEFLKKFLNFNLKNEMLKTRLLITSPFTIHQKPPMSKHETLKRKRVKLHTKAEASYETH
jgi:hypothetical protein